MKYLLILFLMGATAMYAQQTAETANTHQGEISFGVRTTGSLFSSTGNYFGVGAGWQVRYRLSDRSGTEWFADWITTDIGGVGYRYDAHIGESMIIYLVNKPSRKNHLSPYFLGGFCGDYTKIQTNLYFDDEQQAYGKISKDRWSFATQLGLGTHYNLSERLDLSLSGQYVLHFGRDIDATIETNSIGQKYLLIPEKKGNALEGHFFFTLSANYVIADLSKK
ncbi:MAG: outer membrane beta-barrel protein [Bacteroidetes bacterium]|nr:outer membrane beta-barrel protein [Bacteroidota bacterium]